MILFGGYAQMLVLLHPPLPWPFPPISCALPGRQLKNIAVPCRWANRSTLN